MLVCEVMLLHRKLYSFTPLRRKATEEGGNAKHLLSVLCWETKRHSGDYLFNPSCILKTSFDPHLPRAIEQYSEMQILEYRMLK